MNYTHIVAKENYNLICVDYDEENKEKYPDGIAVDLDSIPNMYRNTLSEYGLQREGRAKSLFLKLWSEAQNIRLYDKYIWNKFDDIVFKEQRSIEDLGFLAKNFKIQWALAQTSESYDRSIWEEFYDMIQ